MKIYIGPYEIAGYYTKLHDGFLQLEQKCDFYTFNSHKFNYSKKHNPLIIRVIQTLNKWAEINRKNFFKFFILRSINEIPKMIWSIFAIFYYDVFIFGFGRSFLPKNIDLPILFIMKKKVIMNLAHGSEARPPFIDGSYKRPAKLDKNEFRKIKNATLKMKKKLRRIEKYASILLGNPASTPFFLTKDYINIFEIGTISEFNQEYEYYKKRKSKQNKKLRILHAPSNREAKGTYFILRCLNKLKSKGYKFELDLIENSENSIVLEKLKNCDFVIDQLYSDSPLPGLSIEAAYFSKPSIVSGYAFAFLKRKINVKNFPPSFTCEPAEIENAIEYLITNSKERIQLGILAKKHVSTHGNAKAVSERYLKLINEQIPKRWVLSPNKVDYLFGAGQDLKRTHEIVNGLIDNYGIASLGLSHKKQLETKFLRMKFVRK